MNKTDHNLKSGQLRIDYLRWFCRNFYESSVFPIQFSWRVNNVLPSGQGFLDRLYQSRTEWSFEKVEKRPHCSLRFRRIQNPDERRKTHRLQIWKRDSRKNSEAFMRDNWSVRTCELRWRPLASTDIYGRDARLKWSSFTSSMLCP